MGGYSWMKNKKNAASNVENRAELNINKNKSCPPENQGRKVTYLHTSRWMYVSLQSSGQLGFTQL